MVLESGGSTIKSSVASIADLVDRTTIATSSCISSCSTRAGYGASTPSIEPLIASVKNKTSRTTAGTKSMRRIHVVALVALSSSGTESFVLLAGRGARRSTRPATATTLSSEEPSEFIAEAPSARGARAACRGRGSRPPRARGPRRPPTGCPPMPRGSVRNPRAGWTRLSRRRRRRE